jgi:hypothetical protein
MRKSGAPVGACVQAATSQLRNDGIDAACLKPLEDYVQMQVEQVKAQSEGKESEDDGGAAYFKAREGPTAEELLAAFGITEGELRTSMQTSKTNAHAEQSGFDTAGDMKAFLTRYVHNSEGAEESLRLATEAGHTKKQLAFLRVHLDLPYSRSRAASASEGARAASPKAEAKSGGNEAKC